MTADSAADFLVSLVEPTRLRILNCVAAAPLFVSDLVALLALPQPTVSRHLRVLRELGVVHDTPLPPFVLYQFDALGPHCRLVRVILDTLRDAPAYRAEQHRARETSRADVSARASGAPVAGADAP